MSLLALDVGFCNTGWSVISSGIVIACGTIITERSVKKSTRTADDYYARAGRLATELADIIELYEVKGIVGELPSGGAQSAKAMVMMNMSTAVIAAVASMLKMPCEWCTPTEVKLAVCAFRSATKDDIMNEIRVKFKNKGDHLFPKEKGRFEHIADSLGAYLALRDGNIVRMFDN